MTKYLHTMIRVSSLDDTIAFFEVLGLREFRRRPDEKGRYTNVFLAAPGDEAAALELTYNWDPEPYTGGRNFGHLAYAVDNIYDTCSAFIARGVTINRPPYCIRGVAPTIAMERGLSILSIDASCGSVQNSMRDVTLYHEPVLAMLVQGSAGGSPSPACKISMEMPSGVRMKAIRPSRGGRLIVTPWAMKALQVS